jgi:hypothetical protein
MIHLQSFRNARTEDSNGRRTRRSLALMLAASLGIAACSGAGEAEESTTTAAEVTTTAAAPTTTVAETTTTSEPEPEEVLRMPLTGEIIESEAQIPVRPPLAVKIDNHPRGRPQTGLNEADIVFEEIVEGSLTRFAAVFHTQGSDPVGPIRSGRTQDIGILSALRAPLFAWSGGNAGVTQMIRGSTLLDIGPSQARGYYRRSGVGGAPHNLYSSTDVLWEQSPEEFFLPAQIFPYLGPDEELVGDPASSVTVQMDGIRVRWDYDDELGLYLRFQNDAAHMSELTGQVSSDNIVVMGVSYVPSVVDARSPEAITIGVGPVVIVSDGVARSGFWSRESIFDPFMFTANDPTDLDPQDYEIIGLAPGRTWVELARNADNFAIWE